MDITNRCDPCQRIHSASLRFRVSFGSNSAKFNERLFTDIFYITIKGKKCTILHIIDEVTRYISAQRLFKIETTTVWNTIIKCWSCIYTGFPNRIIVYQGSNFGEPFIRFVELYGVKVKITGIEAHNWLSFAEIYHSRIRNTVRKILTDHPKAGFELVLCLAVKALNDTARPDGLVPSCLVLENFHNRLFSIRLKNRPTNADRGRFAVFSR